MKGRKNQQKNKEKYLRNKYPHLYEEQLENRERKSDIIFLCIMFSSIIILAIILMIIGKKFGLT